MQIKSTAHFANDLGLDSLDTVEVVMAIEEVRDSPLRGAELSPWSQIKPRFWR